MEGGMSLAWRRGFRREDGSGDDDAYEEACGRAVVVPELYYGLRTEEVFSLYPPYCARRCTATASSSRTEFRSEESHRGHGWVPTRPILHPRASLAVADGQVRIRTDGRTRGWGGSVGDMSLVEDEKEDLPSPLQHQRPIVRTRLRSDVSHTMPMRSSRRGSTPWPRSASYNVRRERGKEPLRKCRTAVQSLRK